MSPYYGIFSLVYTKYSPYTRLTSESTIPGTAAFLVLSFIIDTWLFNSCVLDNFQTQGWLQDPTKDNITFNRHSINSILLPRLRRIKLVAKEICSGKISTLRPVLKKDLSSKVYKYDCLRQFLT